MRNIDQARSGRPRARAIGRYAIALSADAVLGQLAGGLLVDADLAGTLLAVGGSGLGLQFATLIGHVMNAVEGRFAADVSGVSSTLSQLGGPALPSPSGRHRQK